LGVDENAEIQRQEAGDARTFPQQVCQRAAHLPLEMVAELGRVQPEQPAIEAQGGCVVGHD
jgi:hypothetical protein